MHTIGLPLYAVIITILITLLNHLLGMLKSWLKIREMRIKRSKKKPTQMDILRKRFSTQRKRNRRAA